MRHAYHHGPFGAAVCALLTADRPGWLTRALPAGPPLPGPVPAGGPVLVAATRELPWFDAIDEAAFRDSHGWLPVVHEHPYLRVGPLIHPGVGACLRCYHARARQHAVESEPVLAAARRAYETDPGLGPSGHLSAHAAVAAALARLALTGSGGWPAGTVARWHVISQELTVDRVVGVHNCPRCGIRRDATDRALHPLVLQGSPV